VHASDPLVHAGLHSELRDKPAVELVGSVDEAEIVVALAEPALRDLPASSTRRLVLVADEPRRAALWTAIERGLVVFLPRGEATTARLLRAIADARRGRGDVPADELGALLLGLSRLQNETLGPRGLTLSGLSGRENDVLRLLADGLDIGQIAQKLSCSERTVKNTLHCLFDRLRLTNRTHAVAYAIRHGLI
jgi:DNA-binding NarL/FixJ family response regulator